MFDIDDWRLNVCWPIKNCSHATSKVELSGFRDIWGNTEAILKQYVNNHKSFGQLDNKRKNSITSHAPEGDGAAVFN